MSDIPSMEVLTGKAKCLDCVFCATVPNDLNQCRRNSPRGPIEINEYAKDWPYVSDDDWCGEFFRDPGRKTQA